MAIQYLLKRCCNEDNYKISDEYRVLNIIVSNFRYTSKKCIT